MDFDTYHGRNFIASLVLLIVLFPWMLLSLVFFFKYRNKQHIRSRQPMFMILFAINLTILFLDLTLGTIIYPFPCGLVDLILVFCVPTTLGILIVRNLHLLFRYEITRESLALYRNRHANASGLTDFTSNDSSSVDSPLTHSSTYGAIESGNAGPKPSTWYIDHRWIASRKAAWIMMAALIVVDLVPVIEFSQSSAEFFTVPYSSDACSSLGLNSSLFVVGGIWLVGYIIIHQRMLAVVKENLGIKLESRIFVVVGVISLLILLLDIAVDSVYYFQLNQFYLGGVIYTIACFVWVVAFLGYPTWEVYQLRKAAPHAGAPMLQTVRIASKTLDHVITEMRNPNENVYSLSFFLQHPVGMKAFMDFLSLEFSAENLMFWADTVEVEKLYLRGLKKMGHRNSFASHGPLESSEMGSKRARVVVRAVGYQRCAVDDEPMDPSNETASPQSTENEGNCDDNINSNGNRNGLTHTDSSDDSLASIGHDQEADVVKNKDVPSEIPLNCFPTVFEKMRRLKITYLDPYSPSEVNITKNRPSLYEFNAMIEHMTDLIESGLSSVSLSKSRMASLSPAHRAHSTASGASGASSRTATASSSAAAMTTLEAPSSVEVSAANVETAVADATAKSFPTHKSQLLQDAANQPPPLPSTLPLPMLGPSLSSGANHLMAEYTLAQEEASASAFSPSFSASLPSSKHLPASPSENLGGRSSDAELYMPSASSFEQPGPIHTGDISTAASFSGSGAAGLSTSIVGTSLSSSAVRASAVKQRFMLGVSSMSASVHPPSTHVELEEFSIKVGEQAIGPEESSASASSREATAASNANAGNTVAATDNNGGGTFAAIIPTGVVPSMRARNASRTAKDHVFSGKFSMQSLRLLRKEVYELMERDSFARYQQTDDYEEKLAEIINQEGIRVPIPPSS